jgi:predicted ArsR family transcriptional regulator
MTDSAASLGSTLRAVMSHEQARTEVGTASATRSAVLEGLRGAGGPVTNEELASHLDLHINTVRGHLDALVEDGFATVARARPEGPGRPKKIYEAVGGLAIRLEDLSEQLDSALDSASANRIAREAARSWRGSRPPATPAKNADDAVNRAVVALRDVGFEAEADSFGTSIAMSACPYASLIKDYPVICAIHAELLSLVLEETDQPVSLQGVDVWLKRGQCRARLNRPDLTPEFSIPSESQETKEPS